MKTIIFDFGNVVGFFDLHRTLARVAPFTDMQPDEIFQSIFGGPLEVSFEKGHISGAEYLAEVRRVCRLKCDDRLMSEAFSDIFQPNAEVCDLIPTLSKRYRLLLGSNTNQLHSDHYLQEFADVLSHFDELVLSHRVHLRKPDAEFFKHCVERAGCAAPECVFVDDMPANIASARAVGLHGILYQPGANLAGQLRELGIDCR